MVASIIARRDLPSGKFPTPLGGVRVRRSKAAADITSCKESFVPKIFLEARRGPAPQTPWIERLRVCDALSRGSVEEESAFPGVAPPRGSATFGSGGGGKLNLLSYMYKTIFCDDFFTKSLKNPHVKSVKVFLQRQVIRTKL